ncbi:hypothetical protein DESA109040_13810 [Deinococcus saxicola]|uniref:hypothetical protein n=1 Tax=Deinococcus saxicola TaxID=249406 RepID=UPI0039EE2303
MKIFDINEPFPAGSLSPLITEELRTRAQALVTDLYAAGISVAITLDAGDDQDVPAWILGDARRIAGRLTQAAEFLKDLPCDCEKCHQKRGQVQA